MSGILYIVATPIGNLGDVTERARETLASVDIILAEDTRVTLKLLAHLGISKRLISYSEHSSADKDAKIISELLSGANYALVSDAGTPAISDPGARIVGMAIDKGITVIPIPGASAVSALVSIFGKPQASHHFWGFFPQKNKRQEELVKYMTDIPGIHVFFESPFRIMKTLEKHFAGKHMFHLVVGREMTKKFESYIRGTPDRVIEELKNHPIKGEFCVGVMTTESNDATEEP